MRNGIRALSLALAASLLMLFALACKSGGGDQTSYPDDDTSGDLVSADPLDVLAASGARVEQGVALLQPELALSRSGGARARGGLGPDLAGRRRPRRSRSGPIDVREPNDGPQLGGLPGAGPESRRRGG